MNFSSVTLSIRPTHFIFLDLISSVTGVLYMVKSTYHEVSHYEVTELGSSLNRTADYRVLSGFPQSLQGN